MKTYLAKLLFNVAIDNDHDVAEFDEQLRMIQSSSIESALYKARHLGRKEEESFVGAHQKKVTWKFIDVAEIYPLEEVKDGQQLYSNSLKVQDANSYLNYIRRKSMELQTRSLSFV